MSCGVVICSVCRSEVHQDGQLDQAGMKMWQHCEDKSPKCTGATIEYASFDEDEPRGNWCGSDGF